MRLNTFAVSSLIWVSLLATPAFGQGNSASSTVYSINPENSILRVFVGRAGPLARFGHNHVVHTQGISGEIELASEPVESSAAFSFPVSSFVVDEQSERDRAGDGFESQPGESAIEGTRENMMGEDVLNATAFGTIAMTVSPVTITDTQWLLAVDINFQGSTFSQEIPAQVTVAETQIDVTATFALDHEDLGLSLFSALGGGLRVAESIDFELQIRATAQ